MKKGTVTSYLVVGILGIAACIILILLGMIPGTMFILFGILGFTYYAWGKKKILIAFKDEHLELKLAPAAPLTIISYKDIVDVEEKNSNIRRIHYKTTGGKVKKIAVGLKTFEENDREIILQNLRECRIV